MSTPTVPVEVKPMAGGAVLLSPADVTGGRRRRGSRKMSKKLLKMLKALKMKGGEDEMPMAEGDASAMSTPAEEGGRRRRRGSRKTRRGRKSRRGFFA